MNIKHAIEKGLEAILVSGILWLGINCKNSENHNSLNHDPNAYCVDQEKGDDSSEGTFEFPWKTIGKANQTLQPGEKVIIKKGIYNETIAPVSDGTQNSPIIYQGLNSPIIRGKKGAIAAIDLKRKKHIIVDDIQIINPEKRYASLTGAEECTIENCVMEGIGPHQGITIGTYGDAPETESSYIIIRKNKIKGYPKNVPEALETISLFFNAHHILIEENEIEDADHTAIYVKGSGDGPTRIAEGPHHNVIRNNTISNKLHHCISEGYGAHDNLYEGNLILFSGPDQEGFHLGFNKAIIRFNTVLESGSPDLKSRLEAGVGFNSQTLKGKLYRSSENKICHNLFAYNRSPGIGLAMSVVSPECFEYPITFTGNNSFVNNIIVENSLALPSKYENIQILYRSWKSKDCNTNVLPITGDVYRNNIIGVNPFEKVLRLEWPKDNNSYTTQEAEQLQNPVFKGNFSADPQFLNPDKNNFGLSLESPARNAGDFLTLTTNAGYQNTQLEVKDSSYFTDGWGITEGDTIQVGQNKARIISNNTETNTLSLEKPLSWNENDPVSLPYSGARPDIGHSE